jgi:hypothetical protein
MNQERELLFEIEQKLNAVVYRSQPYTGDILEDLKAAHAIALRHVGRGSRWDYEEEPGR